MALKGRHEGNEMTTNDKTVPAINGDSDKNRSKMDGDIGDFKLDSEFSKS